MDGRTLYDGAARRRAAALFEGGLGHKAAASLLGIPRGTVRQWLDICRSAGVEALAMMGEGRTERSPEAKLAAVRAAADEGMAKPEAMAKFGTASPSSFKGWPRAYREGGPEALGPKPGGRPRGAGPAPGGMTREQELERRAQKLEAENAYLKESSP